MEQDKFRYAVTFSALEDYPAEVYYGYFTDSLGKRVAGVPKAGKESGGWQFDGAEAGQGGSTIPSHFHLVYVAYGEKKFYEVEGDLPSEKILALFREGYDILDRAKKDWVPSTYDILTIGAAPGGVVVVWLSGNHHRREIGRYQAKEVFVDKEDFRQSPNPAESQQEFFDEYFKITVPKETQEKIAKEGIPFGIWDRYRKKYDYRFVIDAYDEKDYIEDIFRINFNGETEYLKNKEETVVYKEDSAPYSVNYLFNSEYKAEIRFDDEETLNAFETLHSKYPDEKLEVVIKPTFMYEDYKMYVRCKQEEIELHKYVVKRKWKRRQLE
ncbi:DUF2931 family protein [Chishuiella sp.]|uniref:DUF2931 family protein n=1 Tax=Chishuiella sp. TaxID=1969467 RepID=UPI0028A8500F|nr:DUF2931 family protein [Chishuiella sp.]